MNRHWVSNITSFICILFVSVQNTPNADKFQVRRRLLDEEKVDTINSASDNNHKIVSTPNIIDSKSSTTRTVTDVKDVSDARTGGDQRQKENLIKKEIRHTNEAKVQSEQKKNDLLQMAKAELEKREIETKSNVTMTQEPSEQETKLSNDQQVIAQSQKNEIKHKVNGLIVEDQKALRLSRKRKSARTSQEASTVKSPVLSVKPDILAGQPISNDAVKDTPETSSKRKRTNVATDKEEDVPTDILQAETGKQLRPQIPKIIVKKIKMKQGSKEVEHLEIISSEKKLIVACEDISTASTANSTTTTDVPLPEVDLELPNATEEHTTTRLRRKRRRISSSESSKSRDDFTDNLLESREGRDVKYA